MIPSGEEMTTSLKSLESALLHALTSEENVEVSLRYVDILEKTLSPLTDRFTEMQNNLSSLSRDSAERLKKIISGPIHITISTIAPCEGYKDIWDIGPTTRHSGGEPLQDIAARIQAYILLNLFHTLTNTPDGSLPQEALNRPEFLSKRIILSLHEADETTLSFNGVMMQSYDAVKSSIRS